MIRHGIGVRPALGGTTTHGHIIPGIGVRHGVGHGVPHGTGAGARHGAGEVIIPAIGDTVVIIPRVRRGPIVLQATAVLPIVPAEQPRPAAMATIVRAIDPGLPLHPRLAHITPATTTADLLPALAIVPDAAAHRAAAPRQVIHAPDQVHRRNHRRAIDPDPRAAVQAAATAADRAVVAVAADRVVAAEVADVIDLPYKQLI